MYIIVYGTSFRYQPESLQHSPYEVQSSLIEGSASWMVSKSRKVVQKVPLWRAKKLPNGSTPHSRLHFPPFQKKMYKVTAREWSGYEAVLRDFTEQHLGKRIGRWSRKLLRGAGRDVNKHNSIPLSIWQTGKHKGEQENRFQTLNPSAIYNFLQDEDLERWVAKHFQGTSLQKVWDNMERTVLKADLWRYLTMFIDGGVYSGKYAEFDYY